METRFFLLAALASPLPGFAQEFTPVEVPPHEYTGGWEFFVGGGVAVFDCNQDLLPDLFAAGGAGKAKLLQNTTPEIGGPLGFAPAPLPDLTDVVGAYPLDIDSDGIMDLALLRVGENQLLRGGPDCSFAPFPESLGFASDARWSTAFSATWEAGATLPTLAFGNYVDRSNPEGPFGACDQNQLYRPEGAGQEDRPEGPRYEAPQPLLPAFCPLSMLFSDWSRQGRADLRTSNDRHYYVTGGSEQLWEMAATPRLYTEADGWARYNLWGMGIASRDISGDGLPDVFLSSMGDQRLQLLRPGGTPTYVDVPFERGTAAQRPYTGDDGRPSTGWQIAFADAQNDGLDDVFISKGNVQEMPGLAMNDPDNLLIQQPDGRFVERGLEAGVASMDKGRGAAFEDLNLDGLPDIVVVNREAPLKVYQNTTAASGNWLLLSLAQPAPNVNAVGAWLEISDGNRLWSREITVGGGHAGGSATLQHFGLGAAETVQVRIRWPGQDFGAWQTIASNQIWQITPSGIALLK